MLMRNRFRAPLIAGQSDKRQAVVRLLASAFATAALMALLIVIIAVIDSDV